MEDKRRLAKNAAGARRPSGADANGASSVVTPPISPAVGRTGVARRVPDDDLPIYEALIRTLFVPDVKSAGPALRHASHFSPTTEFVEVLGAAIRVGSRSQTMEQKLW